MEIIIIKNAQSNILFCLLCSSGGMERVCWRRQRDGRCCWQWAPCSACFLALWTIPFNLAMGWGVGGVASLSTPAAGFPGPLKGSDDFSAWVFTPWNASDVLRKLIGSLMEHPRLTNTSVGFRLSAFQHLQLLETWPLFLGVVRILDFRFQTRSFVSWYISVIRYRGAKVVRVQMSQRCTQATSFN
jgi:hypothetical protein